MASKEQESTKNHPCDSLANSSLVKLPRLKKGIM